MTAAMSAIKVLAEVGLPGFERLRMPRQGSIPAGGEMTL